MRYGNPSIEHGLTQLNNQGVDELLLLPLPSICNGNYRDNCSFGGKIKKKKFPTMKLEIVPAFYNKRLY